MTFSKTNHRRKPVRQSAPELFDWADEQRRPPDYAVRWVSRRARISAWHASVIVDVLGIGMPR